MLKLFAHRGFHNNQIEENSLLSLDAAYQNNFIGIEFDLQFYQHQLLINHDEITLNNYKNYPKLADFLIYKNHFYYWLDFKNIDKNNCQEIAKIVKKDVENAKIDFSKIYFAPFVINIEEVIEIYRLVDEIFDNKINFIPVCEEIKNHNELIQITKKLTQAGIKNLSICEKILTQENIKILSEFEIFAWTVNQVERIKELEKFGVRNFVSDLITPKIYDQTNQI